MFGFVTTLPEEVRGVMGSVDGITIIWYMDMCAVETVRLLDVFGIDIGVMVYSGPLLPTSSNRRCRQGVRDIRRRFL